MNRIDNDTFVSQEKDGMDDLLIHQLYQTMRAFSKTLNNEIYTADVYSSEWSVLKMVKKHDMISQLELANMLNVEPAAISKTIKKMEEKNLVERKRLQGKREKYIFLTNHALEIYDFLQKKVSQHRMKALDGLSKEDRYVLFKLMRRIYDNTLSEK